MEIARLYGKNESSIREVMKNKEIVRVSFSVAPQTANFTAIARDKELIQVGKNPQISGCKNVIFIAYAAL